MWFNSMAVRWCDKPCESPNKCKEEKKPKPSGSLSEVVAFCSGHVCVLGLGWNSTSIYCYCPFATVRQVARWNVAVSASSFIPSRGKEQGLEGGGWFCFISAWFWAGSLWSFLIIWISFASVTMFFWYWSSKCFFSLFFHVALVLCKEESLHCVWCLPVSTYNSVTDSSFGSRLLQLSTLYGSEGVCCRVLHSNFIE